MEHQVNGFSEIVISFLRKVFQTRVVLDDGSWIEFADREGLLYGEPDGHTMFIVIYPQGERLRCKLLYSRNIRRWEPPHATDEITAQKKLEIQEKVAAFCRRKRYALEIDSS
jgi:hypothetical protein